MLVIRLTRKGKKNQPFFRVVVVDKRRSAKGGRAVEVLGYVDPLTKRKSLEKERILYWIKNGAQPSATIHNLLVSEKIIDAPKISKFKKSKKSKESIVATPTTEPAAPVGSEQVTPVAEEPTEAPVIEKTAEAPKAVEVEKPNEVTPAEAEKSANPE